MMGAPAAAAAALLLLRAAPAASYADVAPQQQQRRLQQQHLWVEASVSAEGQASALKGVHMPSLMARHVYVVGEGGVVLKANVSQGMPGREAFETVLHEVRPAAWTAPPHSSLSSSLSP